MDSYEHGFLCLASLYYFRKWTICKEGELIRGSSDEVIQNKCGEIYNNYKRNTDLLKKNIK
jgi:hypothetical protein